MNGYPVKLLEFMVKVNKILAAKKLKIKKLKEMNSEAEKRRSFGEPFPQDFERKYAGYAKYINSLITKIFAIVLSK